MLAPFDLSHFGFKKFNFSSHPDISINYSETLDKLSAPKKTYCIDEKSAFYFRKDFANYVVKNGNEINIHCLNGINKKSIENCSLNFPIALCMNQKGYLVMHASCVEYKNKTFLFSGPSHSGKSSLAASIMNKGGKLIAEDLSVIDLKTRSVILANNYIKLSKRVANILDFSNDSVLHGSSEKRYGYNVQGGDFSTRAIDLCFFLHWGESLEVSEAYSKNILENLYKFCFVGKSELSQKKIITLMSKLKFYNLTLQKNLDSLKDNSNFIDGFV